jgi:hypothetical protein
MAGPAKFWIASSPKLNLERNVTPDEKLPNNNGHSNEQRSSKTPTEYVTRSTQKLTGSAVPNWVLSTRTRGRGLGSGPIPAEEYLIDDRSPVDEPITEKVIEELTQRFVQRFAHMTSSKVAIKEDSQQSSVVINLNGALDEGQQRIVEAIEKALNGISYMDSGMLRLTRKVERCD